DREAGAIDAGLQGAELVRERLREHRHDAVGEIDRVAALFGNAVERILGPDIPGDIGDGDDRMPGAVLLGIGLGPNRIVEIARIGAVDRHQWDRAQIGALAKRHRRCALGECQRFRRECRRDAVAVDGDEAEGTRFAAIAETLENARGGKAHGGLRLHLGEHDLAVLCLAGIARRNAKLAAQLAVGRLDHPAIAAAAIDAENAIGCAAEGADDARFPAAPRARNEAHHGALADAERRGAALGQGARAAPLAAPSRPLRWPCVGPVFSCWTISWWSFGQARPFLSYSSCRRRRRGRGARSCRSVAGPRAARPPGRASAPPARYRAAPSR